jgi:hypothetical protein
MKRVALIIFIISSIILFLFFSNYYHQNKKLNTFSKEKYEENIISSCSYSGEILKSSSYKNELPLNTQIIFNKILQSVNCRDSFNLRESDVPVAAAILIQKNSLAIREILFNSKSINEAFLNNDTIEHKEKIIVSILAHEIAHHILGHTLKYDESRPLTEIEADRFSGYISGLFGSTLEEAQLAVNFFSNEEATKTHPSRVARLLAVKNGYNDGKSMDWQSYTFIQPNTPGPHDKNKEENIFNSAISDAPIFAIAVRNRILSKIEKRYIDTKDSIYFDKIQAETLLATLLPGTPVNVLRKFGDYYEIEAIVGNRRIIGYINVFEYGKHSILRYNK